jgi:hypothetical protein
MSDHRIPDSWSAASESVHPDGAPQRGCGNRRRSCTLRRERRSLGTVPGRIPAARRVDWLSGTTGGSCMLSLPAIYRLNFVQMPFIFDGGPTERWCGAHTERPPARVTPRLSVTCLTAPALTGERHAR